MEESKIKQLMEMGFSHEKAVEALRKANNDSALAVAYLFDEPEEQLESLTGNADVQLVSEKQVVPVDTVEIRNPQDIPQFYPKEQEYPMPPDYTQEHAVHAPMYPENQHVTYSDHAAHDYPRYNEYSKYSSSDSSIEYSQSVYNLKHVYKRIDTVPPVIIPQRAYLVKNYLAPLVSVFAQLNLFKKYVFEVKGDDDLPYNEDWFKGGIQTESETDETKFALELQKSVAFLTDISKRSFVSSTLLSHHFNLPLNIHTLTEQIEEIIKTLYTTFGKINGNFDKLFKSVVESVSEEFQNDIYIFLVDLESRGRNIYESLNSMFWVDEEKLGDVRFVDISPVLTFQIPLDDDSKPFTLHEEFFPEIYSLKYSQIIEDLYNQRVDIHEKRKALTNEIMLLNTHDGKLIRNFLGHSIQHLSRENELAAQDLSNLQDKLVDLRHAKTEVLTKMSHEYSSLNVYNYQNILDRIAKSELEKPTKYLIVGVILSDCEFFYRSNKLEGMEMDESWYYITALAEPSNGNPIVDYSVQTMTFDAIKTHVYEHAEGKQLVLVYAKDGFDSEEVDFDIPEPLRKFLDQDNQEIDQIQRELKDQESEIVVDDSEDDNETPEEEEEKEKEVLDIENEEEKKLLDI